MVQLCLADKTAVLISALPRRWVSREGEGKSREGEEKCCRERMGRKIYRGMGKDKRKYCRVLH